MSVTVKGTDIRRIRRSWRYRLVRAWWIFTSMLRGHSWKCITKPEIDLECQACLDDPMF